MSWMDELLFPRRCPVCLDITVPRGAWICDACRDKLQRISDPCCMKCGRQLVHTEDEYCTTCAKRNRSFIRGIAGWDYASVPVRQMIAQVKYHNKRQLLDYPCRELAYSFRQQVKSWGLQCLVPVPLHSSKKRKRGFNQSQEIAVRLGNVWGIPVETELLYRIRKTRPQKELDEAGRMRNLLEAFAVSAACAERYRTVALVDDIYTTGNTMEACTRVLHRAGIAEVYSIALSAGRG